MYLGESDVGGLLAEALTADVKTVLADETGLVGADAAVICVSSYVLMSPSIFLHIRPPRPTRGIFPAHPPLSLQIVCMGVSYGAGSRHTTRGSPCRRSLGGSSRHSRET